MKARLTALVSFWTCFYILKQNIQGQRPNRANLHLYLIKNGVFNRSAVEHTNEIVCGGVLQALGMLPSGPFADLEDRFQGDVGSLFQLYDESVLPGLYRLWAS